MKAESDETAIPPLAREILEVIIFSFLPRKLLYQKLAKGVNWALSKLEDKPLVVKRLLEEHPWEKAALAELYLEYVIRAGLNDKESVWYLNWKKNSPSLSGEECAVFIESGSTNVYVSELLRRLSADPEMLRTFPLGTNNHLTAWLFLNKTDYVPSATRGSPLVPNLSPGQLEGKYHGIFPFYSDRSEAEAHPSDERDGYAQLRLTLAKSNLLILAASRLSLIHGPLVGSRENAIFKNACYNACVRPISTPSTHEIHLFLNAQKLVAHQAHNREQVEKAKAGIEVWKAWGRAGKKGPRPPKPSREQERLCSFHTWTEERQKIRADEDESKKCFPAFNVSDESETIPSPFQRDMVANNHPQRLPDGTNAIEMGDGRFRICDTWLQLFTKAGLTVKAFVVFPGKGIKSNPTWRWIQSEVEYARTSKDLGLAIRLDLKCLGELKPRGSSQIFSLALIRIEKK